MSAGSTERLVYMANQIATFFVSQPGDTAALKIADHLTAFWDPAMRRAIIAHVDAGGLGLAPAARTAVELLRHAFAESLQRTLAAAGEESPGHRPGDDAG